MKTNKMRCPYKTNKGYCDMISYDNVKRVRCRYEFTDCPKLIGCKSRLVILQKLKESQPQPSVETVKAIVDLG